MKSSPIVVLTLFLLCLLFSFSASSRARLIVGTVYIRTDGSIDPPIAQLQSSDNMTYSLTGNLSSCIVIERNNVVFNGSGYTISGTGSGNGIELSGRKNVTIENIVIRGFYEGILIYNFSTDNTVSSVKTIENSYRGISLDSSSNNDIRGNMLLNDAEQGISLSGNAYGNSISENIIEGNQFVAINLISSPSGNSIEKNSISHCFWYGIHIWMSSCDNVIAENNVTECGLGIEVSYSSNNNTIYRNNFSMNSKAGVAIGYRIPESGPEYGGVADNYFIENNVTNNKVGIYLIYSKNNTILHNNIQGNNASIIVYGSYVNIWNDESRGNYWSDYNGTDADHDGIGDTPYVIDANNADLYPLVVPNEIIPEFPSIQPGMFFMLLILLTIVICKKRVLSDEACEKKGS